MTIQPTMDKVTAWKTFNLCKEVSLAGNFIYNGLKIFDDMETLSNEDEIFEFLYNVAVGIERLAKVVICINEPLTNDNIVDFEQSLITHNHLDLIKRITGKENVFSDLHFAFLQILTNFYKSWRYDRFSLTDLHNCDKEKQALVSYITKYLKIEITDGDFFATRNDIRIKKFIGRTIGKIVTYLYDKVITYSHEQHVFTYEVRPYSKAYKIFLKKEFDFVTEEVLWKEVLVYCLHNCSNKHLGLYKTMPALNFDYVSLPALIKVFRGDISRQVFTDLLDTLYEDVSDKNKRLAFVDLIGDDDIVVCDDDDTDSMTDLRP